MWNLWLPFTGIKDTFIGRKPLITGIKRSTFELLDQYLDFTRDRTTSPSHLSLSSPAAASLSRLSPLFISSRRSLCRARSPQQWTAFPSTLCGYGSAFPRNRHRQTRQLYHRRHRHRGGRRRRRSPRASHPLFHRLRGSCPGESFGTCARPNSSPLPSTQQW